MKTAYLTIDLDMVNYTGSEWAFFDEMDLAFEPVYDVLSRFGIPATWFLRIDRQIEKVYGESRYMFAQHTAKLSRLHAENHQVGWHYHAYTQHDKKWIQNLNDAQIVDELEKYGALALQEGLQFCRMGWGYHSQSTMKCVDAMGFLVDSSAIPRPVYAWSPTHCNWSRTGQTPYHPSRVDFQTSSFSPSENLRLLEVPMSTAVVSAPYDTQRVIRYINAAYRHPIFKSTLASVAGQDAVVLILHPYECLPRNDTAHALLSFDLEQFALNLQTLLKSGVQFETLQTILQEDCHANT